MALTLGQGAQMVADLGYQARVRSGMVRAARTVMTETIGSMSTNEFAKRKALATQVLRSPDPWVGSFLAAVASDSAASLTWFQPTLIASSTNANPTVVTTATVHGLVVGDVVEIRDHLGNTNANGVWTVTVVGSTTTFTIPHPANAAATVNTGWAMKMETDITVNFTIGAAFSGLAGTYTGDA
jgi:hypothetical protein